MSAVTLPTIDAVIEYVPYSVRLAAKRAQQLEAAAAGQGAERRVHQRLRAADLKWLRGSRVKNGADVTLVDLSAGGVLLDSDVQLKPGTMITLEIVGAGTVEVRSEVLRCQLAALRDAAAVYRGALAFKSPIDLGKMEEAPAAVNRPIQAAVTGGLAKDCGPIPRWCTPQGIYTRFPSQPWSLFAVAEHQCCCQRACARTAQPSEGSLLREGLRRQSQTRLAGQPRRCPCGPEDRGYLSGS